MKIMGYIYGFLLVLFVIILLISWVISLLKLILCSNRKNCQIKNCPLRKSCKKAALTPEEKEEQEEALRQLRNMLLEEFNSSDDSQSKI